MGRIVAICLSEQKGVAKHEVESGLLIEDWGLDKDAHAGHWHRQLSLLAKEKIDNFRAKGAKVENGAFGENLIVEGFDLAKLPVGSKFRINDIQLELTQIGKECHSHCEIFKTMGDCIMPREGVFCRVLRGGQVFPGDEIILAGD